MANYFLMVGKEENWQTALNYGLWVSKRKNPIKNIKTGDKVIAYLSDHKCAFFGIFEAISNFYQDGALTQFDVNPSEYPYRVKIKPEKILENPVSIRPIINALSFIQDSKKWGIYFQNPIRQISGDDYEKILSHITTFTKNEK